MSHETESPPGESRADPDAPLPFQREPTEPPPPTSTTLPNTPGHVMSPGTHLRPQTMVGIGSIPPPKESVPPAPLTEVEAAPEIRRELSVTTVSPAPSFGAHFDAKGLPRPRPSETMVGATSPLHTAEDANTEINLSSMSPDDASRILAAAEADGRALPRRAPTLLSPAAQLPPPPALRRSIRPPAPTADYSPASARARSAPPPPVPAARSPRPPPPSSRGSYPPPPPRRPNTLLLYGAMDDAAAPPPAAPVVSVPVVPVAGDGRSIRGALGRLDPDEATKRVHHPTMRAGPPPPAEEAQRISSSSLVDDLDSSPEIEPDAEPDAPGDAEPEERPAPFAAFAPTPLPRSPSPFDIPTGPPMAVVPLGALLAADPFGRPTEPPRLRDLPPSESSMPTVPPARASRVLPAAIAGGVALVVLVVGGVAFSLRGSPSERTVAPLASASVPASTRASSPPPAASAPPPAQATGAATDPAKRAPPPPSESASGAACVLAGAPHTIAPRALLRAGIETASSDNRLALGVGLSEHEGFLVALDPSTFAVVGTAHPRTPDAIRRVVPVLSTELTSFLETTHPHAKIEAVYPVLADPSFVLGVARGKLVWAATRTSNPTPLWPVEGAPEALRAVALPGHAGYAVAFRQGSALYLGALKADKTTNGELVRIGGLGPQIGAPTLAAGTDHVLVAWADRTGPTVPWGIRWVKWHPGTDLGEPTAFPLASTTEGATAMAPSLTSLAGGRFVIAWTEAVGALHVVRAQALDGAERPVGSTLTVSGDGVNAGEGSPVFTPDGRGAVVFLATPTGATASVVAVPIICPSGA